MIKVSREQFYAEIGNKDAVIHLEGTHPSWKSIFKLRNGAALGFVREKIENGERFYENEYFINEVLA